MNRGKFDYLLPEPNLSQVSWMKMNPISESEVMKEDESDINQEVRQDSRNVSLYLWPGSVEFWQKCLMKRLLMCLGMVWRQNECHPISHFSINITNSRTINFLWFILAPQARAVVLCPLYQLHFDYHDPWMHI